MVLHLRAVKKLQCPALGPLSEINTKFTVSTHFVWFLTALALHIHRDSSSIFRHAPVSPVCDIWQCWSNCQGVGMSLTNSLLELLRQTGHLCWCYSLSREFSQSCRSSDKTASIWKSMAKKLPFFYIWGLYVVWQHWVTVNMRSSINSEYTETQNPKRDRQVLQIPASTRWEMLATIPLWRQCASQFLFIYCTDP